ncbi:MAG: hypothetical protein PHO32_05485, partial [Candidatus Cloacimonetes bacterium]|nr:hypothetical protein [Candidatus Cloacimonadota bacterium]
QFGSKFSFLTLFALNLGFTLGVWLSLRYIFFTRFMLRFRTAAFALVAAVLLSLYFKILFMALHMPLSYESWSGYFWNSLFLFIFIGFGLSVADVIIIRKEVDEERIRLRNQPIEEDEEEEDDGL